MKRLIAGILAVIVVLISTQGFACTTWAVAGQSAASSGTIVAKNRDWVPDHITDIRLITPKDGYRYISMNAEQGSEPSAKGGVNEKGFIVFTQSPPTAELESYRGKLPGHRGNSWLLSHYSSVREALAALQRGEWSANPEFIVFGDAHEVAYVEMGRDGQYAVRTTTNGTLAHANHYLEPELLSTNPAQIVKSSLHRQQKATEQLAGKTSFSFEDIINFTKAPVVWRTDPSNAPLRTRTLASMVVESLPSGEINIWVKLANPDKEVYESHFTMKEALDGKVMLPFI